MPEENKSRTILVIDDDPVILKLLESLLKAQGYIVIASREAAVGLEIAINRRPDLVILDVMMPIINGFNICRLMKSEHGHKHIPIILLTSRAADGDREIGMQVGADAYIAKPVKTEELLRTIQEFLVNA